MRLRPLHARPPARKAAAARRGKSAPQVQVGTPLCARLRSGGQVELGRIASIEHNKKGVDLAKRGSAVAIKIEPTTAKEGSILVGRHFDEKVGFLPPHLSKPRPTIGPLTSRASKAVNVERRAAQTALSA